MADHTENIEADKGDSGGIRGDSPIKRFEDDRLDRRPFVDAVVQALMGLDSSDGAVVAVCGPWGSGKTSVLNLIRETLEEKDGVGVMRYDPWLLSDSTQMVRELIVKLHHSSKGVFKANRKISTALIRYAKAFEPLMNVPTVGVAASIFVAIGRAVAIRREEYVTTDELREKVEAALRKEHSRMVIVIDDLDRLEPEELATMVRVVRAVARFPNVVYLLAFDDAQVAKVLGSRFSYADDDEYGRRYMEKVVQYTFTVPEPGSQTLAQEFRNAIDDSIGLVRLPGDAATAYQFGKHDDRFSEHGRNVLQLVERLPRTLRDIARLRAILPPRIVQLGEEMSLTDLIALEAIRVIEPELHSELGEEARLENRSSETLPEPITEVLATLSNYRREILQGLLAKVFPAGGDFGELALWRAEGRVASPMVLSYYLEGRVGERMATAGEVTPFLFPRLPAEIDGPGEAGRVPSTRIPDLALRLAGELQRSRKVEADAYVQACRAVLCWFDRTANGDSDAEENLVGLATLVLSKAGRPGLNLFAISVDETAPIYGQLRLFRALARPLAQRHTGVTREVRQWVSDSWYKAANRIRSMKPKELREFLSQNALRGALPLSTLVWALETSPNDREFLDRAIETDADQLMLTILLKAAGGYRSDSEAGWNELVLVFGGPNRLAQEKDQLSTLSTPEGPDLARLTEYLNGVRFDPFDYDLNESQNSYSNRRLEESWLTRDSPTPGLGIRVSATYGSSGKQFPKGTDLECEVLDWVKSRLAGSSLALACGDLRRWLGIDASEIDFHAVTEFLPDEISFDAEVVSDDVWLKVRFTMGTGAGLGRPEAEFCEVTVWYRLGERVKASGSEKYRISLGLVQKVLAGAIAISTFERPDPTLPDSWTSPKECRLEGRVAPLGRSSEPVPPLSKFVLLSTSDRENSGSGSEWSGLIKPVRVRSLDEAQCFSTVLLRHMVRNASFPLDDSELSALLAAESM